MDLFEGLRKADTGCHSPLNHLSILFSLGLSLMISNSTLCLLCPSWDALIHLWDPQLHVAVFNWLTDAKTGIPQAADLQGSRDLTDSPHYYCVHTSAASHAAPRCSLPQLPPGNLIPGLPAALMSRAQVVPVPALVKGCRVHS